MSTVNQANPARATDAPTEAEAAAGNRALFVPPPTIADLRALAETAGIAWSLAWVESQDIVRLDPDAKPPVVAYNDRKPKRMYDEELIRAKGILEAIIAEAKALSDRHSDVQDERAGAFDDDEPADAPRSRTCALPYAAPRRRSTTRLHRDARARRSSGRLARQPSFRARARRRSPR